MGEALYSINFVRVKTFSSFTCFMEAIKLENAGDFGRERVDANARWILSVAPVANLSTGSSASNKVSLKIKPKIGYHSL